jgi:AraC-like DNA-binding protein
MRSRVLGAVPVRTGETAVPAPGLEPAEFALVRLADAGSRLNELAVGELSVRVAFAVSYDNLPCDVGTGIDPARAFRLLGTWGGSEISVAAAAALFGVGEPAAAAALEILLDSHLLRPASASGHCGLHSPLRVYAAERARDDEQPSVRHVTQDHLLARSRSAGALASPPAGIWPQTSSAWGSPRPPGVRSPQAVPAATTPSGGWQEQFQWQLAKAIDRGEPSLGAVAAHLAMSRRTLQRRLAELGTSWRIELDAARQRRAEHARLAGSLKMTSLARHLGYADPRSLRRARRRWAGGAREFSAEPAPGRGMAISGERDPVPPN